MRRVVTALILAVIVWVIPQYSGLAVTEIPKTIKQTNSISLTPVTGGYIFSGSDSLNPTALYGLKVSYDRIGSSIVDSLGIEGTIDLFNTTTKTGSKHADGYLFRCDAIYSLTPRDKVVPFLALGMGDITVNRDTKSNSDYLLNYGVGVKYYLREYLALRADARQLFVYQNVNTRNNYELSFGLTYLFGKEHKAAPKLVQKPKAQGNEQPTVVKRELTPMEKLAVLGPAVVGFSPAPIPFEPPAPPPVVTALAFVGVPVPRHEQAQQPETAPYSAADLEAPDAPATAAPAAAAAAASPATAKAAAAAPAPTAITPKTADVPVPPVAIPLPGAAAAPAPGAAPPPAARAPRAASRAASAPATPPAQNAAPASPAEVTAAPLPVPVPVAPERAGEELSAVREPVAPAGPVALPAAAPAAPMDTPVSADAPVLQPEGKFIKYVTVRFEFGKNDIGHWYDERIKVAAALINGSPTSTVVVEGHTDSIGKSRVNQALSVKRAQALKDKLVKLGVDPKRIAVKGYGFSRPVAKNNTAEGRQKNRRAVAVIVVKLPQQAAGQE